MTAEAIEPNFTQVQLIPLDQIEESRHNPRKTFSGIEDLAENIRVRGVLSPVLARPQAPGRFELVFGARRYRAARLAGLSAIPAMVRQMDDNEALETMLIENAKRDDVHPLEEADALDELRSRGYTQERLAEKLGRDAGYVRRRLRLSSLVDEVREMLLAGRLFVGHAELLAGLAESLQLKAATDIARVGDYRSTDPSDIADPMTVADAADHIRHRYLLRLATAPFDVADPDLVPAADACDKCPKNTGAQRDLFEGVADGDSCTDPDCWDEKAKASFAKRAALAQKSKREVIRDPARVFDKPYVDGDPGRLKFDAPFVDLDEERYIGEKTTTYRQLLGAAVTDEHLVLAKDHGGAGHDLVRKKDLAKIAKSAGVKLGGSVDYSGAGSGSSGSKTPKKKHGEMAPHELERLVDERAMPLILASVVAVVEKQGIDNGVAQRWLCDQVAAMSFEGLREVEKRRGIKPGKFAARNFAGRALAGAMVELIVAEYCAVNTPGPDKGLDALLAPWKLKPSKIYAEVREKVLAEHAGKNAPKADAKPNAKPLPKKGKPTAATKGAGAKKTKRKNAGIDGEVT